MRLLVRTRPTCPGYITTQASNTIYEIGKPRDSAGPGQVTAPAVGAGVEADVSIGVGAGAGAGVVYRWGAWRVAD